MAKKTTKPKQVMDETVEVAATFKFKPKNPEQEFAWRQMEDNDYCFLSGIAGSGKTTCAIAYGVQNHQKYDKIIVARPAVESGESLGFLPGALDQKLAPFLTPIFEAIGKSTRHSSSLKEMIGAKIEVVPLAYARGRTFEKCFCVLDEAQNADPAAIEMFMTRLGYGSKMVLCGDDGQPDIVRCVLGDVAREFFAEGQAGWVRFTESVRHPRIVSVIKIMSKFKEKRR